MIKDAFQHMPEEENGMFIKDPASEKEHTLPLFFSMYLLYLDTLMFLCNVWLVIILPSTLLG